MRRVCLPRQDLYPICGKPRLSEFSNMGRSQVVLECELVTSKQLLSCWKQKILQDFLMDSSSDIWCQKTQRFNSSCWHSSPDHDALWKFDDGFHAAGLVSFVELPPNSWFSVSERNAELRLIREDNSRPLSNCPAPASLWPKSAASCTA